MKRLIQTILGFVLLIPFLLACSTEVPWTEEETADGEKVQMVLDVCVPSAVNVRSITNNTLLQDFVLLAFQDNKLLWVQRHNDPQVQLNGTQLKLYINKVEGSVKLMMLANLGTTTLPNLTVGASQSDVEAALKAVKFDCSQMTESSYIPMHGELELPDGLTPNTNGTTISLRRSVARISVEITNDNGDVRFVPSKMKVVNVNTTASIIPAEALTSGTGTMTVNFTGNKAEIYVADTNNDPNNNSRISVLIKGTYTAPNAEGSDAWYRLDLIKESDYTTISSVERNNHYSFTIKNLTYGGSKTEEDALEKTTPDNDLLSNFTGNLFEIYSEYIFSITCEYSSDGTPFFVGVSETNLEMGKDDASVGVLVLTNLVEGQGSGRNWKVAPGNCGAAGEEECKDCFLFEDIRPSTIDPGSTLGSNTHGQLWMMYVEKTAKAKTGVVHNFDIVCGNVRKPMTITIVD